MTAVARNPSSCCSKPVPCDCCAQDVEGVYVTVRGYRSFDPGCDCEEVDGTYWVPAIEADPCNGGKPFDDVYTCEFPLNPDYPQSTRVGISWSIGCQETEDEGYYDMILTIGVSTIEFPGPPFSDSLTTFSKTISHVTKPFDCSELSGEIPAYDISWPFSWFNGHCVVIEDEVPFISCSAVVI